MGRCANARLSHRKAASEPIAARFVSGTPGSTSPAGCSRLLKTDSPPQKETSPMEPKERKKASDFPQELLDIFDLYARGKSDGGFFRHRAKRCAAGGLPAPALGKSRPPTCGGGEGVPKDESPIKRKPATVPSPQGNGSIKGYLARPAAASGKLP